MVFSFYPLLLCFYIQITYREVRNLQIGVDKLVGKLSINLLRHKVRYLCDQHNINATLLVTLIVSS